LPNADASINRVATRVREGGHGINVTTLRQRFPRTQKAVAAALNVADASILVDNSRTPDKAFTVCRVQVGPMPVFDVRRGGTRPPPVISAWLDVVAPE
jgi:predicted ABC-type ATPase